MMRSTLSPMSIVPVMTRQYARLKFRGASFESELAKRVVERQEGTRKETLAKVRRSNVRVAKDKIATLKQELDSARQMAEKDAEELSFSRSDAQAQRRKLWWARYFAFVFYIMWLAKQR